MKKNDVFTFTAPNGAEVTAIVVDETHVYHLPNEDARLHTYLCYGQNRLFYYAWLEGFIRHTPEGECWEASEYSYVNKLVDYCVLPDYDNMLELHQAMDYPTWEQNMEKPDPDEGEDIFWDSCAEEHNKQEDV